jgi:uronate dehydrogenase
MPRILMTGASGGLGTLLRPRLKAIYPGLRLSDRVVPRNLQPDESFVPADLTDLSQVEGMAQDIDCVLHLGGISVEDAWQPILEANIVGTYNLFEAAYRNGVKRIVFASSNHAIGFYPRRRRIGTNERVRPDTRYGVSKAFGEAVASFYADKFGLRVLCIRIGNVAERPVDRRRLAAWLAPDDFVQLIRIGFEHPDLHCEIVYGASDNDRCWWDNETAHRLGYRPAFRAEDHAAFALAEDARRAPDPIGDRLMGGPFCTQEFAGDPDRL